MYVLSARVGTYLTIGWVPTFGGMLYGVRGICTARTRGEASTQSTYIFIGLTPREWTLVRENQTHEKPSAIPSFLRLPRISPELFIYRQTGSAAWNEVRETHGQICGNAAIAAAGDGGRLPVRSIHGSRHDRHWELREGRVPIMLPQSNMSQVPVSLVQPSPVQSIPVATHFRSDCHPIPFHPFSPSPVSPIRPRLER